MTSRLARTMMREAHHLRDPRRIRRPGYTRQQLCLAALAASDVELAEAARREIEELPGPQLPAHWTTARFSLALGYTLAGHTGPVRSVAVTPDGAGIVSGGHDGTVRVWDLATGAPLGEPLTGHTGPVYCVAVTPDGTRIVSGGGDRTVRVWDLATGGPLGEPLTGHSGLVSSVAVTPDGTRIVSGSHDGTVRAWDLATGECLLEVACFAGVTAIAAGPAGENGCPVVAGDRVGSVTAWTLKSS
jgi:WD40 repeat protein